MAAKSDRDPALLDPHMSGIAAGELHFLRPEASFSHLAAIALTKQGIHKPDSEEPPKLVGHEGFNGIDYNVRQDPSHSRIGLLPLEDPGSEPVNEVQAILFSKNFVVLGETNFLVKYVLAGVGERRDVKHVMSHFKGITRGRKFIEGNRLHPIPTTSTSAAAQEVARLADPEYAALCSLSAAQLYGLDILAEKVGWDDKSDNRTKFVIIRGRNGGPPRLRYLESHFRPDEEALVTGIMAPRLTTRENGFHISQHHLIEISHNAIVPIRRGSRGSQPSSVGGDAEYLVTLKGPAGRLFEALRSDRFKELTKFKKLGIYPVATLCEEPAGGLYPDGPPLDLAAMERDIASEHPIIELAEPDDQHSAESGQQWPSR